MFTKLLELLRCVRYSHVSDKFYCTNYNFGVEAIGDSGNSDIKTERIEKFTQLLPFVSLSASPPIISTMWYQIKNSTAVKSCVVNCVTLLKCWWYIISSTVQTTLDFYQSAEQNRNENFYMVVDQQSHTILFRFIFELILFIYESWLQIQIHNSNR